MDLPPPLLVQVEPHGGSSTTEIEVAATGQREVALAFGKALLVSRAARGWRDPLTLHAAADRPAAAEGQLWVPHVCCVDHGSPALIWERGSATGLEEKLGAAQVDIERWAQQPQALLRLASIAGAGGRFIEAGSTGAHLSLRWVLSNQELAAAVASTGWVEIDHVSLHVARGEEEDVLRLLVEVLGLVEIPRPTQITIPGRWLQAGRSRVHLNSRCRKPNESDFPGPRPNHLCFRVEDLDAVEVALEAAGVATRRAGSLGQQLWFRLAGTSIELQPLPA